MRPEDLTKFFEDAIAKIVPRDDAHREKLERFQEKVRASNLQLGAEIDKLQKHLSDQNADTERLQADVQARSDRDRKYKRVVAQELDVQTELISRIAARLVSRRDQA